MPTFLTIWHDENCDVECWDVSPHILTFIRDDCMFSLTIDQLQEIIQKAEEVWK